MTGTADIGTIPTTALGADANVVPMERYRSHRARVSTALTPAGASETGAPTAMPPMGHPTPTSLVAVPPEFDRRAAAKVVAPDRLADLDSNNRYAKFRAVARDTIEKLRSSSALFASGDNFEADDAVMAARADVLELYMFRDLHDSLGLVVGTCLQALMQMPDITTAPDAPRIMVDAIEKISRRPFMALEEAMELSEAIDESVGGLKSPVYDEMISLGEDETEPSAKLPVSAERRADGDA